MSSSYKNSNSLSPDDRNGFDSCTGNHDDNPTNVCKAHIEVRPSRTNNGNMISLLNANAPSFIPCGNQVSYYKSSGLYVYPPDE